jgi:predicted GIY-YIG superfamily endonuclease
MTDGTVYLLHFDPPYKQARHYLGHAADLEPRLNAHQHGKGARLTQVAIGAGCALILARTWDGGLDLERRLKRRHNAPALCPICRAQAARGNGSAS